MCIASLETQHELRNSRLDDKKLFWHANLHFLLDKLQAGLFEHFEPFAI